MPPPKEFEEDSANISSNSEIMKFLEENFTQVKLHDEISFFSIFVARNPKKNQ